MPVLIGIVFAVGIFIKDALIALVKHPLVVKMVIFAFFVGLIHVGITFISDLVKPYISSIPGAGLLCALGVFNAIKIYITILIAGWAMKQLLAFVRS